MESIGSNISVSLPSQIAATAKGGDPSAAQVEELGTEFESVFVSMLMKELRNSLEDGLFGGDGSDSFGGMFDLFIGQHLAQSKAIGVSDLLVQQYSKTQADDGHEQTSGVSFSA
ncbi:Peptidoglycan hydrolase FlgJ [Stieleria maiorica]|uniref:Peptidoglycan hydrolase FlgJ n=1 Tax=Stieleria maiorica TaxID=2795974 RepID=A0A5B9MCL3_9BACT|nr:rod-binding protein [Stieleria maiorica]QEF98513.1 Peptidoglycan hydrolase FlgJ [Stieleria maiorica]